MIFPSAADEGAIAAVRVPSFPAGNRRRRKIENYVFFSVSYRYICRHPKQNLAMALYRLESDRTQIGIDLDTKTRDNNLRHPDYARHAQIVPATGVQGTLFAPPDKGKHARLMEALDRVNKVYGRGSIVIAAQGTEPFRMNREHLSPRYTTDWRELLTVKAK